MEKSVVLYSSFNDDIEQLKELLNTSDYEVYEISSQRELEQTVPILENLFIINYDFKETKQYIESLSEYTASQDCFCLLLSSQTIPPHVASGLKQKGLNEIIKEKISVNEIFNKINAFFDEGYLGFEHNKSKVQNEVIHKKSFASSRNVNFSEKLRIERLLHEFKTNKDNSILFKLKNNQLPLMHFSNKNVNQDFEIKIKNKIINNKKTITKDENIFDFDYSFQKKKSKDLNGISDENKINEKFSKYEEDNNEILNKSISYEQDSFKYGQGLAEFKDVLSDNDESSTSFIITKKISEDNPFFKNKDLRVSENLIAFENLREVTIFENKQHDFLVLKGLAEILGIGSPNANKLFLYLNFVISKLISGTVHLVSLKNNKQVDLTNFLKDDKNWLTSLESKRSYLEEINLPLIENSEQCSLFIFPYFWDRVKIGYGLVFSQKVIPEKKMQILELLLMSAKNLVKENSSC